MVREPTLFFLHGFLGQPEMWAEVAYQLTARFPALRMMFGRLPGHGPRPKPFGNTFDACVDAVGGQLPADEKVVLVGYSMGARLALGLLDRVPQRVLGAVLIGVHPGLDSEKERASRRQWEMLMASRMNAGLESFVDEWAKAPLFVSQERLPDAVLARQRVCRLNHDPSALAAGFLNMGLSRQPDFRSTLRRVVVPVLLLTGGLDERFSRLAEAVTRGASGCLFHSIADAGHNPVLEQPQLVAWEIGQFVSKNYH